jgi:ureidoglycolate hydrolase
MGNSIKEIIMLIKPVKLTAAAFKPFGSVIHKASGKPMARNTEITYWGGVARGAMGRSVSTGVLINHRRPLVVRAMERHVKTAEILAALEGDSVFCVARPSKRGSVIGKAACFRIRQGEAVMMVPGCWHWVPYPVGCRQSTFLVVFAEGTEARDLEVKALTEEIRIKA